MENGADFVIHESQAWYEEIMMNCEYCFKKGIPYVVSFICTNEGKLYSGEHVKQVIKDVQKFKPLAISFNCILHNVFDQVMK